MATNTLLTNSIILKEAMMLLDNNLVITKLVNRDFEPNFGTETKNGESIRLARPIRGQVRTGATMQAQDITEGSETLAIVQQIGADLEFTSRDLTLSVDKFAERIIKPQMVSIANYLDGQLMTELSNKTYNWAGTPGNVINSYQDLALAPQYLDEMSVPRDRRVGILSPGDHWALVPNVAGLFIQDTAKTALTKAKLPMVGDLDMYMSQNVVTHTNGSWGTTPVLNNGTLSVTYATAKDTWTQTLTIAGLTNTTGTVAVGDVFTLAGVFAVNQITGATLDFLRQFTVRTGCTADGSGNGSIVVSPPIITSGAYKTCSAAPAGNATITIKGAASTAYKQNLVFHPDAITLAVPKMYKPQGAAWCETQSYEGLNLRLTQGYDIVNDIPQWRFDLIYALKAHQPWLSTRVSGTP